MDFELNKEQRDIVTAAREFALGEMWENALQWDREERTPSELRRSALELGFVGMALPENMGGAGFGLLEEFLVIEEFSTVSSGLTRAVLEPGWGAEFLDSNTHTDIVKGVSEGKLVLGLPEADVSGGQDLRPTRERAGFVLADANLFLIPGNRGDQEGLFLIPVATKGINLKVLAPQLGLRSWRGARVELKDLDIGTPDFLPYRNSLIRMDAARAIRTTAMALGLVRGVCESTLQYVRGRHLFGQTLADFEATRLKFFRFWRELEAGRFLGLRAAIAWDKGLDAFLLAISALTHSLRTAQEVTDEAVQLHGGYGYFEEMRVAMHYRDAKALEMISNPLPHSIGSLWDYIGSIGTWKS